MCKGFQPEFPCFDGFNFIQLPDERDLQAVKKQMKKNNSSVFEAIDGGCRYPYAPMKNNLRCVCLVNW